MFSLSYLIKCLPIFNISVYVYNFIILNNLMFLKLYMIFMCTCISWVSVSKHSAPRQRISISWKHVSNANSWALLKSVESETLGIESENLGLNKPPRWFRS